MTSEHLLEVINNVGTSIDKLGDDGATDVDHPLHTIREQLLDIYRDIIKVYVATQRCTRS